MLFWINMCDEDNCFIFSLILLITIFLLMIGSLLAEPSLLFSYSKQYDHPAFLEANYDIKHLAIALTVIAVLTILVWFITIGSFLCGCDGPILMIITIISFWSAFLSLASIVSCTFVGKAAISNLHNLRDYSIYYPNISDEEYFGIFFFEKAIEEGCNETECLISVVETRYKVFLKYIQIPMYLYLGAMILVLLILLLFTCFMDGICNDYMKLFFIIVCTVFFALPIYMIAIFGQKTFNEVCKAYEIKNYKNYLIPILGLVGCVMFVVSIFILSFDYQILFYIIYLAGGAFVLAQAVLTHLYLINFNNFKQKVPVIDSFKNVVNAIVYIQDILLLLPLIIIFILAFFAGDSQNYYNCLARYICRLMSLFDTTYYYIQSALFLD